jgi:hypothetical protein
MLVDPDRDVRHSAHETVIALAQYGEFLCSLARFIIRLFTNFSSEGVRALCFTTEVVQKVVSMLGDPDSLVRCCACHALTSLAQYGEFPRASA